MRSINRYFLTSILLLWSAIVFGSDTYIIHDNEVKRVNVSMTEFNRIQIIGDRIASVRGPSGDYELQTDSVLGQIFVKPITVKPFTLFLTTESKNTYSIRLYGHKWSARNVELKPIGVTQAKAKIWEEAQPYEASLVSLIKAMFSGKKIEGYGMSQVSEPQKEPLGDIAWVTKYWVYRGAHLTGEIYRVENKTKRPLQLKPAQFYRTDVAAIALSSEYVRPHGSVWLYEVVSHG